MQTQADAEMRQRFSAVKEELRDFEVETRAVVKAVLVTSLA